MDKREKVISDLEEQLAWIRDNDFHKFPGWGHTVLAMRDALELLTAQEPVRHGFWEEHEDCNGDCYYTCSVCDCYWKLIDGTPEENSMRYCPECGAKMDGERGESDGEA